MQCTYAFKRLFRRALQSVRRGLRGAGLPLLACVGTGHPCHIPASHSRQALLKLHNVNVTLFLLARYSILLPLLPNFPFLTTKMSQSWYSSHGADIESGVRLGFTGILVWHVRHRLIHQGTKQSVRADKHERHGSMHAPAPATTLLLLVAIILGQNMLSYASFMNWHKFMALNGKAAHVAMCT
jgi:hypothetical protein